MGKRGPIPQTIQEKRLKGNPGKRKPKKTTYGGVLTRLPSAPKHLDRIAACEWRRMGKALISLGKLTTINIKAFELYCENYSLVRLLADKLKTIDDIVIKSGKNGYESPSVKFNAMNKSMKVLQDFYKILERTPEAVPEQKSDPMEDFIRAGRKLKSVK